MTTKHKQSSNPFKLVGRLDAGTPSAVAASYDGEFTFFVGTEVGLFRSTTFADEQIGGWERLSGAPVGVLCLAVSPGYPSDHTLVMGTNTGIFISNDRGDSWHPGKMTMEESVILSLVFSPNYVRDGIILAGTLEDGVLFSDTRGRHWENKSFGLLDLFVSSLAISPNFAEDGRVFAGTDTAVYFSYNHARAWKELTFPEDGSPILSLAVSPEFAEKPFLFAGTETSGLYRTDDLGTTWQRLELSAVCINAIRFSEQDGKLFAATEDGLFESFDQGDSWELSLDIPNTICIANEDEHVLIGGVEQRIWLRTKQKNWSPVPDPSGRAVVGMCLSSPFDDQGVGFIYGPEEGIWKSADGGKEWVRLGDPLVDAGANNMAFSPNYQDDHAIVIAAQTGLLFSQDGGNTLQVMLDSACEQAVFSPNGKLLGASFRDGGIHVSDDFGKNWKNVPGPWEKGGRILNLTVSNAGELHIAFLEGIGQTVSIWQGKEDEIEKIISQPVSENAVVSFWMPTEPAADRPWFVGVGPKVWRLSGRRGSKPVDLEFPKLESSRDVVICLTGTQSGAGIELYATTGKHLFTYSEEKSWQQVFDFENERAIVLSPGRKTAQTRQLFALFLGGAFYQGSV